MWVAGILVAAALTPAAQAQGRGRPVPSRSVGYYYPSRSVRVVVDTGTALGNIRVQTAVRVPDGGTALVGSYSRLAEARSEYGVPVLGKVPYLSRGFRNVGYGRTVLRRSVTASVRIISLREEEYRQTGFRSP
jgi:type II secretory pathway component GspD/PulD (secretin)